MSEENANENQPSDAKLEKMQIEKISKIPVNFTVEAGAVSLTLEDLMRLKEGDVVALNKNCNEPFILKVNNNKIGEGEIVQKDAKFFIKVLNINSERG